MKTLLLTLLLATLAFAGVAGTKEDSIRMVELEKKVENLQTKLSERDDLYESHLNKIQTERNSFVSFIESNINCFKWILSIATAFVLGLLGFFGWKHGKSLKEYKAELKEDAERELRKARDKAILEISSLIEKDPRVVKSVIDERLKDAELKKKMSICLIYSDYSKITDLKLQLLKFGIENITELKLKIPAFTVANFKKKLSDIVFIIDHLEEKKTDIEDQLKEELKECKDKLPAFFYLGKNIFPRDNDKIISNACRTESTIYQNLLDLMRYVDFCQGTSLQQPRLK
jgi:hypothetical protein